MRIIFANICNLPHNAIKCTKNDFEFGSSTHGRVAKNCHNVHFIKIEKIDAKIDFSAKNSKKFVFYNEELVTNSKFQTQFSRKLQRFRTCHKNKKCSIFHELKEYQQKWQHENHFF